MALIAGTSIPGSAATALAWTAAAGGGDTVAYNQAKKQIIMFKNASGGAITVTIAASRTSANVGRDVAGLTSLVQSIGAAVIRAFMVTPAYVDASGMVNISYTGVTSFTVAVLEI